MPTKLIALPCSASELEAALHKVCDHGGHWANRIHVCLHKNENRYVLELHDEAFDGQRSTQDGAALGCGDSAAMREALELVNKIYDLLSKPCIVIEEVRQVCQKARAVLIAPPLRNCDVGTAEEQEKRFETFCSLYHLPKGKGCYSCPAIPTRSPRAFNRNVCRINWNQMPYEEGERT